jgi:wobble nucleotide-excising tRNase
MIESIHLANEGAYDAAGTQLHGLRKLNFIFGSNGSGKTTISRVIEGSGTFPACAITWAGGAKLETRVYNRDFVERNFDAESSIKGIYTFGENVEVAEKIKTLKGEADEIKKTLLGMQKILLGGDGNGGKKREREALTAQLVEDVWSAKKKYDDLDAAFAGLNNSKKNFCERYLTEAVTNTATVRDIADLREDAATIFAGSLTKAANLPTQDSSNMPALENAAILKKKIIGKTDVDIAALIVKLGNSDWVQQGRQYFDQLDDQCPFCQQKTDEAFRKSLEDYFDQSYIDDLAKVYKLHTDYTEAAKDLLDAFGATNIMDSPYLEREAYEKEVAALRLALEGNIEHIEAKRKEPSAAVTLIDTAPMLTAVDSHIGTANKKVTANNDIIDNLAARKRELISQIWKKLLEDTTAIYTKFMRDSGALNAAITALEGKIEKSSADLETKQAEIEENEKKITSIKPTIDEINKLLKSFGFTNFRLAESAESGFYEVKRLDGTDAKRTLSEGEKSFITFLYFYYLVGGSFSSSGSTNDKVVVFDDPVSSLDADILFIVCNLIKKVVVEMRTGTSPIKQVFVLTHNVYFHKEVTFDKNRDALGTALKDESFWVVRKTSVRSELLSFKENPIKSSYELLWREVRRKPPSDTAIQNVMRRILEHYFKFYGGIKPESLIEKFDGKDKMICSALLSWVNDGSHFATDDLYMACDPSQIDRYLLVFQRIFEESEHGAHFRMMMGDDYTALAVVNEAEAQQMALEAASLAANDNPAMGQADEAIFVSASGLSESAATDNAPQK